MIRYLENAYVRQTEENSKKQEKLDKVVDLIKDKYGYETITRAGDMKHTKNINRKD